MTTLADLCISIDYGYTAKSTPDPDVGPKYLRITDIVPPFIDWSGVPHCVVEPAKQEKFLLREGDIVIARSGSVGYAKQIWERPEGTTFASYLVRFRPNPEKVEPRFLGQIVQSEYFRSWVRSVAGGVAQPNANAKVLGSFEIDLPERDVQRKVAAALGALDDKIDNNRRRIAILEEMARLIYREWFVHFRFPGHEDVEFVDSDLGPIPDGWSVRMLGEVAEVNARTLRKADLPDEIAYIDISSVEPRRIGKRSRLTADEAPGRARRVVVSGDVVWSTVRPNRRAHALVLDPEQGTIASTGLAVLSASSVPSSFLFEWSSTHEFTDYLISRATGSAYPAVRPTDFEEAPIVVPTDELLARFDERIGPMHQLQSTLSRQNEVLREARDLLLPRLVSGELDVSELDLKLAAVG